MPRVQILRVFRAYAVFVRLAYLSAVTAGLLIAGWMVASIDSSPRLGFMRFISVDEFIWFGLLIACIACAARAMIRPLRRLSFLPESHLRERPVVGTLVALAAAFASFLAFNVFLALLQTWPAGDVNVGGLALLALMLFAIALLTGELVLVGRVRPRDT